MSRPAAAVSRSPSLALLCATVMFARPPSWQEGHFTPTSVASGHGIIGFSGESAEEWNRLFKKAA